MTNKFGKFVKIGVFCCTAIAFNTAQAGFITSYALGIPTSLSVGSFAGAALSNSNSKPKNEVSENLITYEYVGLDLPKIFKPIDKDTFSSMHILKEEDIANVYQLILKPNQSIKLEYEWKNASNNATQKSSQIKDFSGKTTKHKENISVVEDWSLPGGINVVQLPEGIVLTNKTDQEINSFIWIVNKTDFNGKPLTLFRAGNIEKQQLEAKKIEEDTITVPASLLLGALTLSGAILCENHLRRRENKKLKKEGDLDSFENEEEDFGDFFEEEPKVKRKLKP